MLLLVGLAVSEWLPVIAVTDSTSSFLVPERHYPKDPLLYTLLSQALLLFEYTVFLLYIDLL